MNRIQKTGAGLLLAAALAGTSPALTAHAEEAGPSENAPTVSSTSPGEPTAASSDPTTAPKPSSGPTATPSATQVAPATTSPDAPSLHTASPTPTPSMTAIGPEKLQYVAVLWLIPGGDPSKPFAQPQTIVTSAPVSVASVKVAAAAILSAEKACTAYQLDIYLADDTTAKLVSGGVLTSPNHPTEHLVGDEVFKTDGCTVSAPPTTAPVTTPPVTTPPVTTPPVTTAPVTTPPATVPPVSAPPTTATTPPVVVATPTTPIVLTQAVPLTNTAAKKVVANVVPGAASTLAFTGSEDARHPAHWGIGLLAAGVLMVVGRALFLVRRKRRLQ